ncbi:hypothetical protein N7492_007036 [Penicillium capsulatum]|uniref:DUF202 domain-containing protein n=1 Tax=Penicillium capsulatum TaxID=69766 RepID=A0A9W9LLA6_9EURO|nr:hypothetical protein N7492_007036 [Penicillium capsulatum]KAJ6116870.1 hypothetical protein N7512_006595 [Penicillium capsulatum]
MNTFDSSATSPTGARGLGRASQAGSSSSRSPTHADSGLSSSVGSSRSHSSVSSQKKPRTQQPPQALNESTPIFNGTSASTRSYQATDAPEIPTEPSESAKDNQQNSHGDNTGVNSDFPRNQTGVPEPSIRPRWSWYGRFIDRFGALELENKGSVARDHLALERTFLAWMRTSLAFASIGIAVTQLFRLNTATATTDANSFDTTSHPAAILPPFSAPISNAASSPQDTSRLRSMGKPLGSTFIGVAILILIVGFHRYFESQYWIVRGKFPASRGSVALTAFVAAALIVAALAVILAVSPGSVEP